MKNLIVVAGERGGNNRAMCDGNPRAVRIELRRV